MDLAAAAERLYALRREEFTRARAELVGAARSDGDRELAGAIGKLRRPTVAAWLVNQMARQRPDQLRSLVELGERMRAAHEQLDGAALRELSRPRRELLEEILGSVRDIGKAADVPVSDAMTRELDTMFSAALADSASGKTLRSGRLSSAKALTDGDAGWPAVAPDARPKPALVRSLPPQPEAPPARQGARPELNTAATELARLREALAEADLRHAKANADYDAATTEETKAHQAIETLRAELIVAEQAQRQASQRARFTRRARDDAVRERDKASRRAKVAADRFTALRTHHQGEH